MSMKREKIADCRRVHRWLIAELEGALGITEAVPYTMPLLANLNALDRLDTEMASEAQ
jgi:hypothetical protein